MRGKTRARWVSSHRLPITSGQSPEGPCDEPETRDYRDGLAGARLASPSLAAEMGMEKDDY